MGIESWQPGWQQPAPFPGGCDEITRRPSCCSRQIQSFPQLWHAHELMSPGTRVRSHQRLLSDPAASLPSASPSPSPSRTTPGWHRRANTEQQQNPPAFYQMSTEVSLQPAAGMQSWFILGAAVAEMTKLSPCPSAGL